MDKKYHSFTLIPVKILFFSILFPTLFLLISVVIIDGIYKPQVSSLKTNPLIEASLECIIYLIVLLIIILLMKHYGIDWKLLSGNIKNIKKYKSYALYVIPIIILSFGLGYFTIWYLTYIYPKLATWLLNQDNRPMILTTGFMYIPANIINFILIVILAPFVEEILFRGLIMSRWSEKWNIPAGIIISTICFGILHMNPMGSSLFGIVLSMIYIKTKSLFIPVMIHMLNNFIAWIMALFFTLFETDKSQTTISEIQNTWQVWVICLIIGIPWLVWFFMKNRLTKDTVIPYFYEQELCNEHGK